MNEQIVKIVKNWHLENLKEESDFSWEQSKYAGVLTLKKADVISCLQFVCTFSGFSTERPMALDAAQAWARWGCELPTPRD